MSACLYGGDWLFVLSDETLSMLSPFEKDLMQFVFTSIDSDGEVLLSNKLPNLAAQNDLCGGLWMLNFTYHHSIFLNPGIAIYGHKVCCSRLLGALAWRSSKHGELGTPTYQAGIKDVHIGGGETMTACSTHEGPHPTNPHKTSSITRGQLHLGAMHTTIPILHAWRCKLHPHQRKIDTQKVPIVVFQHKQCLTEWHTKQPLA